MGSYPPIFDREVSPVDWYPRYVQTYIDRDVRLIRNIGNLSRFQRFVKLCAGRIGQLLNFSQSGCGLWNRYQDSPILDVGIGGELYRLSSSSTFQELQQKLVKQPKLYFVDTGVACALLGIESSYQLSTHYLRGGLFENWVILERLKKRFNAGLNSNLHFWRDNTGHEIDLLEETSQTLHAWEIKVGETVQSDWVKGLNWFRNLAGPDTKSTLVYGGDRSFSRMGIPMRSWRKLT